jgi:hypothetical protein
VPRARGQSRPHARARQAAETTLAVSGDERNVHVGAGIGSLGRLAVFARWPVTGS